MKSCPAEHYIPIYLVVTGSFSLALAVLSCLPCAQESDEGVRGPLSKLCSTWNYLVSIFLFCWFIAGKMSAGGGADCPVSSPSGQRRRSRPPSGW